MDATLLDLPEELLLHITKYLRGKDVVALSHVCQRFLYDLGCDQLWIAIMTREHMLKESDIVSFSRTLSAKCSSKLEHYNAKEKHSYLLHVFVANNWKSCTYREHRLPLTEFSIVGHDVRQLVRAEPCHRVLDGKVHKQWDMTVHDLRGFGFHVSQKKTLNFDLQAEADNIFNLDLCAILVAKFTAVLCFNGIGEDTPQELIALDLSPSSDFRELWRDVSHDWGQFQLMRVFGRHVYKFDLLNNTIDAHDIRSYEKLHSLPLVEEMRYPHGEIAGDGKHLAIPGT